MKKSLLALGLAAVLTVTLTACSGNGGTNGTNNNGGANGTTGTGGTAGTNGSAGTNGTTGTGGTNGTNGTGNNGSTNGSAGLTSGREYGYAAGRARHELPGSAANGYLNDGRYRADGNGQVYGGGSAAGRDLTQGARDMLRDAGDMVRDTGNAIGNTARDIMR